MSTFVLVHGAWHRGDAFAEVADILRADGHVVHTPTLVGNGPGDAKSTGLEEAVTSLTDYITKNSIKDAVLLGHSYGGIVITVAADRLSEGTVRRLVYWSAYVPLDGESLVDITPPAFGEMFNQICEPDGGVPMMWEIFREALINDADEETARRCHSRLTTQPLSTMTDKAKLSRNPADLPVGKSFIHCQEDLIYPASEGGWHPRFSERLGLFRFVSMPGSHEVCFTNPQGLADSIVRAGRD
jgi:pimeloyl-ACP methyl ester carboxylesterase